MLDQDLLSFVLGALPDPPVRVLEVGAGEGELAQALTAAGYDVLAIDPGTQAGHVRPVALHELHEPPDSFDAAVAVVSMHHVEPLPESCRRLAELVRPGGTLVLDEFDVARVDEQAAGWWLAHRAALEEHRHAGEDAPREAPEVVAELRHRCHTLSDLQAALGQWFTLAEPVRGPYLYRWARTSELRETELELIATGRLPETGARITGERSQLRAGHSPDPGGSA